ncbi:outer membrane protein assembly factor BamC [Thalassolituus sp. LLYu03]|uniref:outer membrane protein assembly factor BamC n=1 Tax=Thalassolituus sp. LLYu03 TaxID=3421656 RepID=UPI003D2BA1B4
MMLKHSVRSALLPVLCALASACSLLPDDQAMAYLQADEQAATQSVDGIQLTTSDAYPIPDLPGNPAKPNEFEVPRPAPFVGEEEAETVTSLSEFRNGAVNPRLEKDGAGSLILRLDGSYASNWAVVTEALGKTALKLTDLNRSTGTYYLEMKTVTRKEDCGWWASLWGCDEFRTEAYLLKMNRARNGVYLSLLTDADTLAEEALTADVLNEIKAKLEQ